MDFMDKQQRDLEKSSVESSSITQKKSGTDSEYELSQDTLLHLKATNNQPLSIDTSSHPSSHHKIPHPSSATSAAQGYSAQFSCILPQPTQTSNVSIANVSPTSRPVNLLMKKATSIAFFIDLLSPDHKPSTYKTYDQSVDTGDVHLTPRSASSPLKTENNSSPTKGLLTLPLQPPALATPIPPRAVVEKEAKVLYFPKIRTHQLRPPARELKQALEKRMDSAFALRSQKLAERTSKLNRQAQAIKFRLMIHDSRQRLEKLRLQAKNEYSTSSAQLNRQINIRKVREKFGAKVEHAKRVMLIQKMKKFMDLRRALSENFVDLLRQEEAEGFPTESAARLSPQGLKVSIDEDDDDYEQEELTACDWKIPDSPSETAIRFHQDYSSNYNFSTTTKTRSENLSDSIRRTKSLPDLVLKESDDSTFLELLNLLPPITRFTLRELEMDEILSNAQLRHDILFDPDLRFKATDAQDEESIEKTEEYWKEVKDEVTAGELYRIPLLLAEVRAILVELLPAGLEQKNEIFSNIDTHMIAQQIRHGIMDPTGLIFYISGIMKANCAPIRDVTVEKMVAECEKGDISTCLATCFEVLELMKLDYANHQLSRLRPFIVQHSVEFEWKYFKNQLDAEQTSLVNTTAWLRNCWEKYKKNTTGSPNPAYDLYPEALTYIISQASRFSDDAVLPETLKMDMTHMVNFYNSWQDATILATILIVFKQVSGPKCQQADIMTAKEGLWILLNDSESTMTHITLQMSSMAAKIRGFAMTQKEITDLNVMTEKTLAPGSKLYELVQRRVGVHLEAGISRSKIDVDLLGKHGLTALTQEIEELIEKIVPVAELNRAVYGNLYAALIEDIKAGNEATSPLSKLVLSTE